MTIKKYIAMLAAAGMLAGGLPAASAGFALPVHAEAETEAVSESERGFNEDGTYSYAGVTYELLEDHAKVVSCVPKVTIEVPDTIQDLPVTEIGKNAFSRWAIIETVTLPDTVTVIGEGAFKNCPDLKKVVLPQGLTSLPKDAFDYCPKLEEVNLPESLQEIGDSCFTNCWALVFDRLPDNINRIGDYAFMGCTAFESVTLPLALRYIGRSAFVNCHNLESVYFPPTIEVIGDQAFSDCEKLANIGTSVLYDLIDPSQDIVYFRTLERVGENAFRNTAWLEREPDGVVYFCEAAVAYKGELPEDGAVTFRGYTRVLADGLLKNKKLTQVVLPDSLQYIGASTLQGTGLTEITLPEGLRGMGSLALSNTPLSELYIPAGVEKIDPAFVSGCSQLESISISEENPYFSCYDGILYDKDLTQIITVPQKIRQCRLSEKLTELSAGQFYRCQELERITLPQGLTSIGKYCFEDCVKLENIELPYGLESIGEDAFRHCAALRNVRLPHTVTQLGDSAFLESGVEHLVLSDGISELTSFCDICYVDFAPSLDDTPSSYPSSFPIYYSAMEGAPLRSITFSSSLKTIGAAVFDDTPHVSESSLTDRAPMPLEDVYFYGTREEWDAIEIGPQNGALLNATLHISAESTIPGDVSWDGELSVTDCVILQKYLLGMGHLTNKLAADVNGDGQVNILDLVLLKRLILQK